MQQKRFSFLRFPLFALSLLVLVTSCHHGVTIHPSKVKPEMKRAYANDLAGLYDVNVRVLSSISGAESIVKIVDGKRIEQFESQDSTLQLKATLLDYDNGMKMIIHNFPVSTLAKVLPDSIGDLKAAIAALPDQELTICYDFVYWDNLIMSFTPQELPFTCQMADGQHAGLRLRFGDATSFTIGNEDLTEVNLILDGMRIQFGAVGLYEGNQLLFSFDDFVHDDFFYVLIHFGGRN